MCWRSCRQPFRKKMNAVEMISSWTRGFLPPPSMCRVFCFVGVSLYFGLQILICMFFFKLRFFSNLIFAFHSHEHAGSYLHHQPVVFLISIFISKSREGCSGGLICAWFAVFCFVLHFCNFSNFCTFCKCCHCCDFCHATFATFLRLQIFISKSREGCFGGFICAWFAVFCFVLHFWNVLPLLQLLQLATFATFTNLYFQI